MTTETDTQNTKTLSDFDSDTGTDNQNNTDETSDTAVDTDTPTVESEPTDEGEERVESLCPVYEEARTSETWQDMKSNLCIVEPRCGHAIRALTDNWKAKWSDGTCINYASVVANFIRFLEDRDIALQDAELKDLDQFLKKRARDNLAKNTLHLDVAVMVAVFKHVTLYQDVEPSFRYELIREELSPADYRVAGRYEPDPLDDDEIKAFLDAFDFLRDKCMAKVGLDLGPRSYDLRTIRVEDVDLEERKIRLKNTKSGGKMWRPLSPELQAWLTKWINVDRKAFIDPNGQPEENPYLFPSKKGGYLSASRFITILDDAAKRARVQRNLERSNPGKDSDPEAGEGNARRRVTPHTLRHTFSRRLMDAGNSLEEVSEALDHDGIDVTEKYYWHKEIDLNTVLNKMYDLLDR